MKDAKQTNAIGNPIGINLSFAVKRWVEPEVWAERVVELGLNLVQFTFDLLDPLWPPHCRSSLAKQHSKAAKARGLEIHSAFVGLACYTYNNLLHPMPEGREAAISWWKAAIEVAAELETFRIGGPVGGMSVRDNADPVRRQERLDELLDNLHSLLDYAYGLGIREWLIEPTPIVRETPVSPEEAVMLLEKLAGPVEVRLCVDVGHALFQPLYREHARLEPWLALGRNRIGALHLQQTDGQSDSHWGFRNPGIVDVARIRDSLKGELGNIPIILEVFYPFECEDEYVWEDVRASVDIIRESMGSTKNGKNG